MLKIKKIATDLSAFFNGIMQSYLTFNVPSDAQYPYLTYELLQGQAGADNALQCFVYSDSEGMNELLQAVERVQGAIGGGIEYNGMWIKQGNPFVQIVTDASNPEIKTAFINLVVRFYN